MRPASAMLLRARSCASTWGGSSAGPAFLPLCAGAGPHLSDDAVVSGMETLTASNLVIGTGGFPEGDQPVVRAGVPQHPERERDAPRLDLRLTAVASRRTLSARSMVPV